MKLPRRRSPREMVQDLRKQREGPTVIGGQRRRVIAALIAAQLPMGSSWKATKAVLMQVRPHLGKQVDQDEIYWGKRWVRLQRQAFWRAAHQVHRERQHWASWLDPLPRVTSLPLFGELTG